MKIARLFSTSTRKAGYMPRPAVAQRDVAAEAIDRVQTTPSSLVAAKRRNSNSHARPRRRRARTRAAAALLARAAKPSKRRRITHTRHTLGGGR